MTHAEIRGLVRHLIEHMRDDGLDHLMELAVVLQDEPIDDLTELGSVLDHYTAIAKTTRQAYMPPGA